MKKRREENNEKVLIVGFGEIGKSIYELYKNVEGFDIHRLDIKDKARLITFKVDIIHICIPYFENFVEVVAQYIDDYSPRLIIINSTVPVGTTRKIDRKGVVHSPVMGVHPHLTESMQTFTKILGSCDRKSAHEASLHFEKIGVKCLIYNTPEDSEASKLLSTSYYAWNIFFNKIVKEYCEDKKLNFEDVYGTTNEIYNEGYDKMGMRFVNRPILKYMEGPINGHCIIPNLKLLSEDIDIFNLLLMWNGEEKK